MTNQTDPKVAKYYRDAHILSRFSDCRLAEAISINIDPTTYLDLTTPRYLELVFESTIHRLSLFEHIEILRKVIEKVAEQTYQGKSNGKASPLTNELRKRIPIVEFVEKRYGLEIKKDKICCPFHAGGSERTPSLIFYPKTNSFFCFGCRVGGDVVEFFRRMEDLKK